MLRKWHHRLFGKAKNQPVRLRPRVRLSLEALEDRAVPATFTVTSTADDGSAGTLRYAISQANASSDATNSINFNLPSGPQTIVLTQGALFLNNSHSTTILGTGANQLFISGNHATTVFSISSGATVALDNLTIEYGSGYEGGGISNSGNLSISDSTLADNTASSYGGAVYNHNATATLSNSILNGNTASYSGGGIYNYNATATISNSTLTNNRAGFYGGGIYNYDYATTTISNSTLAYNAATIFGGGGIYNTFQGTVHVNNSTLAGNTGSYGGGIYNNYQGTLTVNNSTLADNTANNYGGGIYNIGNAVTLGNSIVAGNIAGNDPDVLGPFDSLGHNLIGIGNGGSGFNDDLVGSLASPLNPGLASLANNGGPTQTMALLKGSPAIDAGSDALVPIDPSTGQPYTTDQRGSGYFRISGSSVDIGAYEYPQQSPQTITFNPLPNETYGDADFALTATASSGLTVSYSATGNATVHQDSDGNWFAHLAGVGTAAITASQAGNGNYFAAPNVSQLFTIAQATPTIPTPNVPANAVYNGQPQGATVDDVTGVNGTDLGAPTLTYYAGTYTLANLPNSGGSSTAPTAAGNYTVVDSYAGSTDYTSAGSLANYTISPLTVTLSGSRGYDGTTTADASLLNISNLVSGDQLSLSGSAALASADAGAETITDVSGLSLSGSASGNYTLVGTTGTVTIGQATPTVPTPIVPSNAVYNGQPQGATVGDVTGVNGTDLGAPTLTYYAGTYTLANLPNSGGSSTAPTNAGNYTVVASYAGSTDYSSVSSLATYNISPLAVTLSGSRGYDGTATADANLLSVSNLVSGDQLSLSGSAALASADAGAETITDVSGLSLSGSASGNYTLVGTTGTVTIGQATPTVPTPIVPSNAVYNGQPQGATVGDVTGVNGADLGAPTLTYYTGTYTLANLPNSGGSSTAPTNAGNYTVVASYAGSTDYKAVRSLATYSIGQATTAFSHLTVKQIRLGTKTVSVSGQLTFDGIVPAGQSVSITLNGVTRVARVGPNGSFSVRFATGRLKVGVYAISYSYGGSSYLPATSGTGSLTVAYGTRVLFNNYKPVHSGAVLPIKLELTNSRGADVSSHSIAIRAVGLKDSNGNPVSLKSASNANPNNLFRYDHCLDGYVFDLDTKGLKAGTYTFSYKAGNDPTLHSLTFVVHDHHCRSRGHGGKGIPV